MQEELIIEAGRTEKHYWKDLWRYKELFYILSWRDIKVRYKQTVIGIAWGVVRPLLAMVIFTFIFGKVAGFNQHQMAPYSIIVFAGLLPWQFFSTSLSEASNSLVGNANLISKVYFPRMIIPAAAVITSLVDFLISFGIMVVIMLFLKFAPPIQVLFLPLFILLVFLAAFGTGLYITALNVKYRDFRYIVPVIVQFGMYVSPVPYSTAEVVKKTGESWRNYLYLNPMTGIIDGFRWCLVGEEMYWPGFFISLIVVLFFLFLGIWYFRKTEKSFADNI